MALNSTDLHELYFASMGGEGKVTKTMSEALVRDFGSVERWRTEFSAMGYALGGGSGWVLLSWMPRDGRLINQYAGEHSQAIASGIPILALDMYEHAYHSSPDPVGVNIGYPYEGRNSARRRTFLITRRHRAATEARCLRCCRRIGLSTAGIGTGCGTHPRAARARWLLSRQSRSAHGRAAVLRGKGECELPAQQREIRATDHSGPRDTARWRQRVALGDPGLDFDNCLAQRQSRQSTSRARTSNRP